MKKVLILGGSKGIGLASAEIFSSSHEVTVLSRSTPSTSKNIRHIKVDFKNLEEVKALALNIKESSFDILINNSGGPKSERFQDVTSEYFLSEINSHLISAHILTQAVTEKMIKSGNGRIINIISVTAKNPLPNMIVSNTIRGAMLNWSKTLSKELGATGITVNNILPGYTSTKRLDEVINSVAKSKGMGVEDVKQNLINQIPCNRFGIPEELAKMILFLSSEDASYINGQSIAIDGGWLNCN